MVGGVGAYTAALANALAETGAEVAVLTSARAQPPQPLPPARVAVAARMHRWNVGAWRDICRTAQEMNADWVHVQYQTAAFAMNPTLNMLAQPRAGFRLAWTYHDLLPAYLFPKAGARLRQWVTERPAPRADLVIVTNEGDRQMLVARTHNLHAIPIGSNIQGVQLNDTERRTVRAHFGYGADDLLLGYFGFLNRSKGGDTLITALDTLVAQGVNAHLLMIGDRLGASDPTNAATLAEIEAMIAARGLNERVRWTGRLDDAAAGAALNAVDLLLLPFVDGASLRRGTLMAGLANGCAIITTQPQHALPQLVDGSDLLYVPPSDAIALAAAVRALAAAPEGLAQLRTAARARSADFGWPAIAAQHLALYTAAANSRMIK